MIATAIRTEAMQSIYIIKNVLDLNIFVPHMLNLLPSYNPTTANVPLITPNPMAPPYKAP